MPLIPQIRQNLQTHEVTATGIASGEAFGAQSILIELSATGIASAEAFGLPSIALPLFATGIPSTEAFGIPTLLVEPTATGVPSAQAFGQSTILVEFAATSIASADAFGLPTILVEPLATSIASAEAFGLPTLLAEISATGIATAEAFGLPTLLVEPLASSIPSAEAFGAAPSILAELQATGVPSTEAFGLPTILADLVATSIPSAEAFGAQSILIEPLASSIPSGEAFGAQSLETELLATGIPSEEAFGIPNIGDALQATGIPSEEAFGQASILITPKKRSSGSAGHFGVGAGGGMGVPLREQMIQHLMRRGPKRRHRRAPRIMRPKRSASVSGLGQAPPVRAARATILTTSASSPVRVAWSVAHSKLVKRSKSRKARKKSRRNPPPFTDLVEVIVPGFGGFVASRFITRITATAAEKKWPHAGRHAGALASVGTFFAAWLVAHRIKWLAKYHVPIVVGAGIAAGQSLIQLYVPKLGWIVADAVPAQPAELPLRY